MNERHVEEVSIGADEYDACLADDYNNFVNTMERSGSCMWRSVLNPNACTGRVHAAGESDTADLEHKRAKQQDVR